MADETLDVYPPRGLGGESDHWGRTVEGGIDSLKKEVAALRQTLDNTTKAQSGSTGSLTDQLGEIVQRVSYSQSTILSQTWNAQLTATNYGYGDSLTFTLDEGRVVSITSYINGFTTVSASNGANSIAILRGGIFLNGAPLTSTPTSVRASTTNNGAFASQSQGATMTTRALVALPAGTHTVRPMLSEINLTTIVLAGATGTAQATASDPSIFVDVLQRA